MDLQSWGVVVSLVIAVASAVFTGLTRWDTRRQAREAAAQTEIERQRDRQALTPQLTMAATPWGGGTDGLVRLTVELAGPSGLDALGTVTLSILDDRPHESLLAGGPTQEQLDAVVWAPYRFTPHVDGADALGRTVTLTDVRPGRPRTLSLRTTVAPVWQQEDAWRQDQQDEPIRVEAVCQRGDARWTVVCRQPQPQPHLEINPRRRQTTEVDLVITNVGTAPARGVTIEPVPGSTCLEIDSHADHLDPNETIVVTVLQMYGDGDAVAEIRYQDFTGVPCEGRVDIDHV